MGPILPSGATPPAWSREHQRLHRHLLRHPGLLPTGATVLLAVSGGQDSMALTALLRDLQRLHHWRLLLWHGDHGWRPESAAQAAELGAWAKAEGLALLRQRASAGEAEGEAAARRWRYGCLVQAARQAGCSHVVTAHTATDRAETVLLHLARGSHRRGLGSLRRSRPLDDGQPPLALVRPLLLFSRAETAAICQAWGIPVWQDPSNASPLLSRNRVRAEVLPVLEALHPGASLRISAQAERLAEELDQEEELLRLALAGLRIPEPGRGLLRRDLSRLQRGNQRRLLQLWLAETTGQALEAAVLEGLVDRLEPRRGAGVLALTGGWRLCWDRSTLRLSHDQAGADHARSRRGR